MVLDDKRVLTNRRFVEGLDIQTLEFDPEAMRQRYAACVDDEEMYPWPFDPYVMDRFREAESRRSEAEISEATATMEMAS